MSKKEWGWKLAKNVVKATIIMGVVGLAVGAAAPLLAAAVNIGIGAINAVAGAAAVETIAVPLFSATHMLTTGATFGAFGAFSAVVTPAVNYMFGERVHKTVTAKTLGVRSRELGYEQAPDISAAHGHSIAATQMASISPTHFQDMISASRAGVKPPGIA